MLYDWQKYAEIGVRAAGVQAVCVTCAVGVRAVCAPHLRVCRAAFVRRSCGVRAAFERCARGVSSEEAVHAAQDGEYLADHGDGNLLLGILGALVGGNEADESLPLRHAQALDGAVFVGDDAVYLAGREVLYGRGDLAHGDDVSVVELGLHGVSGDVAPDDSGLVEGCEVDEIRGGGGLVVEHSIKPTDEVYIIVWCARAVVVDTRCGWIRLLRLEHRTVSGEQPFGIHVFCVSKKSRNVILANTVVLLQYTPCNT